MGRRTFASYGVGFSGARGRARLSSGNTTVRAAFAPFNVSGRLSYRVSYRLSGRLSARVLAS